MTQAKISNNSLAFTETGQGPAIVLLHGLFGSSDNLGRLASDLATDHRVVSVDLPGHGEKNSAINLSKLVIIDIAPRHYPPNHNDVFAALNDVPLGPDVDRRQADKILSSHISEPGIRAFLLKSFRRDDSGAWSWRFDALELEKQYDKLARTPSLPNQVQPPTLFIKGELSEYILPKDEQAIKTAFAAPEFKIIRGTGHWPHAEKPAAFNRIVRRFVTQSSAS